MSPALLDPTLDSSFIISPADGQDAEAMFYKMCAEYPKNWKVEQGANGDIHIMPPQGTESSNRCSEIDYQLRAWAKRDGKGRVLDSNSLVLLSDGSKLGPDAAWVSRERLRQLTKQQREEFLRIVPEFIIELKSPSDRLSILQQKMQDWRRNGVELGWLIDPYKRRVFIYTVELEHPRVLEEPASVAAEGPVEGFVLEMDEIWRGLDL